MPLSAWEGYSASLYIEDDTQLRISSRLGIDECGVDRVRSHILKCI